MTITNGYYSIVNVIKPHNVVESRGKIMLDYSKLINTLKVLADVYGEKEFTSKQYQSMARKQDNMYQAMEAISDFLDVVRVEFFDLPESANVDDITCYYYEGKKLDSNVAKALIKAGFDVEERVEPVQGRRYYYKLKSIDLKQYKRAALNDLADAKESLAKYEKRYNNAKKRVEALEALIDSME